MYDDKEEGEETRAVLPSSHSWRAPTPIRRFPRPIRPVLSSPNGACVCIRACVRACVYEKGTRVLARVSCLRALVWGDVRAHTCEKPHLRLRVCVLARGTGICSPYLVFFSLFLFRPFFPSLFTSPSFSLSKRRRARERYRARRIPLDIPI